ncbi:DUF4342 domain-containing protein [Clostridiisalibacter paucivorans]|uniref:DUF4342 domain-containing protein n=1 Tax=Clostridiisalibacter paucivorans TaxID=408753 RepID=UPI00047E5B43|nr:DUF4342 domain-containing protein [Clostridiisalibacter paucivorans]
MGIRLEDIDTIRERSGIGYKEAKELLEKYDGDVVEALIELENREKSWSQNITGKGDEIVDKIKQYVRKGNVTKITLKKDDEIIMNVPVTAGAIGAIISPPITAIGVAAALMTKCSIEIVKEDGEIVNINKMAGKTIEKVRNVTKRKSENSYTEVEDEEFYEDEDI